MPRKFSHPASRGSILIFSLIILSFLLIAGLSLASLSLVDQKTASTTDRSSLSFQAADSAAEAMLYRIYKGGYENSSINALAWSGSSCNNGVFTGTPSSSSLAGSNFRITFYDNSSAPITSCSLSPWRDVIVFMKSEGTYGNTTRAIQLGIEPPLLGP